MSINRHTLMLQTMPAFAGYIKLTNTRVAQVSWGTPTDASATMVAHRLLLYAMRSNGDNDWPVHLEANRNPCAGH